MHVRVVAATRWVQWKLELQKWMIMISSSTWHPSGSGSFAVASVGSSPASVIVASETLLPNSDWRRLAQRAVSFFLALMGWHIISRCSNELCIRAVWRMLFTLLASMSSGSPELESEDWQVAAAVPYTAAWRSGSSSASLLARWRSGAGRSYRLTRLRMRRWRGSRGMGLNCC